MSTVPIRDAATVVLVRDHPDGLQTWMLTRVKQMVFAGGMSVFPGGRVDDADAELPFAAGAETLTAARYGCDVHLARQLLGAAVRETFEETGVLLGTTAVDLSGARGDVEAGRVSFGELLRANAVTLDASVLRPWARWITPPGEARRYDARFFAAALPAGAEAQDVTSESCAAQWLRPADALAQGARGERGVLPPTIATLTSIQRFASTDALLAAADDRPLDPVSPRIHLEGERIIAELPTGERFEVPRSMFRGPHRADGDAVVSAPVSEPVSTPGPGAP